MQAAALEPVAGGVPLARMRGGAKLSFAQDGDVTRLVELEQSAPLRVLFPKVAHGEPPLAAITTISGGLVGGDEIAIDVELAPKARACALGQAAEKVYRSTGPDSVVEVSLEVGRGAWLEWLPQETILYDGARLDRATEAIVHPHGRLLAGECLVFGLAASAEPMLTGRVRDSWRIRDHAGALRWADSFSVEGDVSAVLASPACLGGARAYATALYVGADAGAHLTAARELVETKEVRSGATLRGEVLIARWLGEDPLKVRRGFERYWKGMRRIAAGLGGELSRLWHV